MKYNDMAFAFSWEVEEGQTDIGWWNMYEEGCEEVEQGHGMNEFMDLLCGLDHSVINVIYVKKLNWFYHILSAYAGFDEGKSCIGFYDGKENVFRLFLEGIDSIEFRNWDNFFPDEEKGHIFIKQLDYCRSHFNSGYKNRLGLAKHFVYTVKRDLWNDIASSYWMYTGWYKSFREKLAFTCPDEFEMCLNVYKGSYCFINPVFENTTLPNVQCFDISSSHSGFMERKLYPSDSAREATTIEDMQYVLKHDFCYIGLFRIGGLEPKYNMPLDLKKFGYEDEGEWMLTLTDVHMKALKLIYNIKSILPIQLFYYPKNYLSKDCQKMLAELYEVKQMAKESNNDFIKSIFKVRCELVFGMSIKKPFYDIEAQYDEETNRFIPVQKEYDFDEVKKRLRTRQNLPYQIGIWTAAYSFLEEIETILGIGLDKVVYGDTDSVKYVGDSTYIEEHNNTIQEEKTKAQFKRSGGYDTPMGTWKSEPTCKKFKAIGPKWYLVKVGDKVEATAGGADKEAITQWTENNRFPFANFKRDMIVPELFKGVRIDRDNCTIRMDNSSFIPKELIREMEHKEVDFDE